jgi:hypothetical protein
LSDNASLNRMDVLWLWGLLAVAALAGQLPRLFDAKELPPMDDAERAQWARKRRWLAVSELSAIPAFATGWSMASIYWSLPIPFVVMGSMASGALGFGFMLHALQVLVTRKVGSGNGA